MSKEFTKSYAINRIAELNEQIVEMTAEQSETMRYLNKLRDNNKQLKQQLEEKDKEIEFCKEEIRKRNKRIDEIVERDKKLFDDKNKEIELLKHLGKHETATEMFKENTKLIIEKTQLAIQELEKLAKNILDTFDINYEHWEFNHKCLYKHKQLEYYDIIEMIDNQIKELKGE